MTSPLIPLMLAFAVCLVPVLLGLDTGDGERRKLWEDLLLAGMAVGGAVGVVLLVRVS